MSNLQTKSFEFEFKEMGEDGEFQGHAAVFNNVDLGGDKILPGAFLKTLERNKGLIPILSGHNIREQIGWNEKAEENKKGLKVKGALDLNVSRAREIQSLTKKAIDLGAKMGLSIGFETIKKSFEGAVRILKELELFEYSFTAFPMNVRATVGNMKGVEMCVDNPFNSLVISMSEEIGVISEEKQEELASYIVDLIKKKGSETKLEPEETETQVRIRIKSPGLFQSNSFRQTTLQDEKPRVFSIVGRLKGETTTTIQSLRFPKDDGWAITSAVKWAKDHDFKTIAAEQTKTPVIYLPESIFTSPREMERSLRDVGGLSISRAKAVASEAFAGLRDVENDEEEMRQLITIIKGLDFMPC